MDTSLCDGISRDDMLRVLGIDPSVIRWPDPVRAPDPDDGLQAPSAEGLSDSEWALIAPYLPSEPAQATAMRNRDFVDAVLVAVARGSWTDRRIPGNTSDAVRRRFGRWAHLEVWRALAAAISQLPLSTERKSAFHVVLRRADMLRR
ncbi:MAG: transposase [Proteobacteria bacterium]|nr:transposase [Pseudomonadota bacterium]